MPLTGSKTFVGFGFGAIQAGLFLYEAHQSGNFGRLVVAEVLPEVVAAIRDANGYFTVNIAHPDRIEQAVVGPVALENPASAADRRRLIEAIAQANELGTAIPSVSYYDAAGPGSLHRLLAQGLRQKIAANGPRAVIYTAENHNHAAEILTGKVLAEIPARERAAIAGRVQFLNTVIGKMSGLITDPPEIEARGLAPVCPGQARAFLVERFNRIFVSGIRFDPPPFGRGISVFEEKANLLPFEEAKLYGHNATHALAAYVAAAAGVSHIAALPHVPGMMPFLGAAFMEESGQALIRKYAGADSLFTPAGYRAYAVDLLARMTNPHLGDTVKRVGRDPTRKLGWDDRLIGVIRLALAQGLTPRRYALGAAAALAVLAPHAAAEAALGPLWRTTAPAPMEEAAVLAVIREGQTNLRRWLEAGKPNLAQFELT